VAEPISLMEHLRRHMGIRLHALGLSSEQIFTPWWREQHPGKVAPSWAVPNHQLLEELVKVGGGDPSRTGDTEVLVDYFVGLGHGVSRALAPLRGAPPLALSAGERAYLSRLKSEWTTRATLKDQRAKLEALREQLERHLDTCQEAAVELCGQRLFD